MTARNKQKFFKHAPPDSGLAHYPGPAGLGERLWLMLEAKRGLGVQVQ